jgi:hypothetical protein
MQNLDEWIAADLLNELTPEERKAFDRYLQNQPQARTLHQQTTTMIQLLDESLTDARPGLHFENRLLRTFRKQASHHPIRNFLSSLWETLSKPLPLPRLSMPIALTVLTGLTAVWFLERFETTSPVFTSRFANVPYGVPYCAQSYTQTNERLVGGAASGTPASLGMNRVCSANAENTAFSQPEALRSARVAVDRVQSSPPQASFAAAPLSQKALPPTPASSVSPAASSSSPSQGQAPVSQEPNDQVLSDGRKLIRNASLDLEVKNYDEALDGITAIATANSGYVATKNSSRLPNGKMSGTVVVKVLPERLDEALIRIRTVGNLKNQALSTRDVTKEYFDTEARLKNARKMEERLLGLLETMKGKITELLVVEKELARVREQIEQLQGEIKLTDSLVQYATITIALQEKDLNEAAAYLLKEDVTLAIFSSDVEKSFGAARQQAEAAKAQIVNSRIDRDEAGRATALFSLLVGPEEAETLVGGLKGLGRIQNFKREDRRVPQDGAASSSKAKIDRDKVQIDFSILQDDDCKKQVDLSIVTKEIESALDRAKGAAIAQGASIVSSKLEHPAGEATSATLSVRVPSGSYQPLMESFKKEGVVSQFSIKRDDTGVEGGEKSPVFILLTLTDTEQPIQFTQASVYSKDVEQLATRLKQVAEKQGSQVEIRNSSYERTSDGRQNAQLVFRLPLGKYQNFMDEIGGLGKMKGISVRRQDRSDNLSGSLTTAEISLHLYNQGDVVAEENGLWATLRKTLGQGSAYLMWSVRVIGVALAFIAPWALVIGIIAWGVRLYRKRK